MGSNLRNLLDLWNGTADTNSDEDSDAEGNSRPEQDKSAGVMTRASNGTTPLTSNPIPANEAIHEKAGAAYATGNEPAYKTEEKISEFAPEEEEILIEGSEPVTVWLGEPSGEDEHGVTLRPTSADVNAGFRMVMG